MDNCIHGIDARNPCSACNTWHNLDIPEQKALLKRAEKIRATPLSTSGDLLFLLCELAEVYESGRRNGERGRP